MERAVPEQQIAAETMERAVPEQKTLSSEPVRGDCPLHLRFMDGKAVRVSSALATPRGEREAGLVPGGPGSVSRLHLASGVASHSGRR